MQTTQTKQTFKLKKLVKVLGYSLFLTLAACGKSDEELAQEQQIQVQAYLSLAEVYMNQGQFRASVIETQNAYDLTPQNPDVLSFIGRLYLEIGDVNLASQQIDAALQVSPDDPELKLLKVESLLATGRIADATALVSSLSVPADLNLRRIWLLGSAQAASGNNEAAEKSFNEALAINNAHAPSLIALARLAFVSGNPEQATTYTERASSAAGTDPDVLIWKGNLAMLQENPAAAEEAFKAALDVMGPYDIMTAKKFATLQAVLVPLRMLQKNDEVLRYSEIIAATPQGEYNTAFNNVLSLYEQGSSGEAEQALNTLLETAPDHPAGNILLGLAKYSEGDYTEAERLLTQYVDTDTASPQLLATLASTHLHANQPDKALALLREAQKAAPDDASLLTMISAVQRGMGDYAGALATLNSALEKTPENTDVMIGIAGVYAQQGDSANSISSLEKAIEIDPNLLQAKSALLNVLSTTQDFASAKRHIDSWLQVDPDSADNNIFAGVLALNQDDFPAARSYFSKVAAADPANIQAKLYLARVDVGEKKYSDAEARFVEVSTEHPDNPDAIGGILALGDLNNSQAASIQRVEQLITSSPNEYIPPLVLSQYYLLRNDLPKAVETAEKAFAVNQNTYTQNLLIDTSIRSAIQALQAGNATAAPTYINRVLEIQNSNVQAHSLLAGIAAQDGNYLRAMDEITTIRNLQPDAALSYELEGDILQAQTKVPEALAAYQTGWTKEKAATLGLKIFQLTKGQKQDAEAMTFLQDWAQAEPTMPTPPLLMAMEYQAQEKNNEAIARYEEVYKLDQNNLLMLNNLAWMYQDSSPARALELASKAAELYPQNADVLDTYGWILYKQGKAAEALTHLENAAKLAPNAQTTQEHLSIVRGNQ